MARVRGDAHQRRGRRTATAGCRAPAVHQPGGADHQDHPAGGDVPAEDGLGLAVVRVGQREHHLVVPGPPLHAGDRLPGAQRIAAAQRPAALARGHHKLDLRPRPHALPPAHVHQHRGAAGIRIPCPLPGRERRPPAPRRRRRGVLAGHVPYLPRRQRDLAPAVGSASQQRRADHVAAEQALRGAAPVEIPRAEQRLAQRYRLVDMDAAVVLGLLGVAHLLAGGADAVAQRPAIGSEPEAAHVSRVARQRTRVRTIGTGPPHRDAAIEQRAVVDEAAIRRPCHASRGERCPIRLAQQLTALAHPACRGARIHALHVPGGVVGVALDRCTLQPERHVAAVGRDRQFAQVADFHQLARRNPLRVQPAAEQHAGQHRREEPPGPPHHWVHRWVLPMGPGHVRPTSAGIR